MRCVVKFMTLIHTLAGDETVETVGRAASVAPPTEAQSMQLLVAWLLSLTPSFSWGYNAHVAREPLQRFPLRCIYPKPLKRFTTDQAP